MDRGWKLAMTAGLIVGPSMLAHARSAMTAGLGLAAFVVPSGFDQVASGKQSWDFEVDEWSFAVFMIPQQPQDRHGKFAGNRPPPAGRSRS